MFDLGIQELIVIFIVALLVFGPKRLPELGKSLGKGIAELKRAMQGVKDQMDAELDDVRKPMATDAGGKDSPDKERKAAESTEPGGPAAGQSGDRDTGNHDKGGKA